MKTVYSEYIEWWSIQCEWGSVVVLTLLVLCRMLLLVASFPTLVDLLLILCFLVSRVLVGILVVLATYIASFTPGVVALGRDGALCIVGDAPIHGVFFLFWHHSTIATYVCIWHVFLRVPYKSLRQTLGSEWRTSFCTRKVLSFRAATCYFIILIPKFDPWWGQLDSGGITQRNKCVKGSTSLYFFRVVEWGIVDGVSRETWKNGTLQNNINPLEVHKILLFVAWYLLKDFPFQVLHWKKGGSYFLSSERVKWAQ